MRTFLAITSLLLATHLFYARALEAGVLFSPAARWQTFAFRPEEEEATPNYYGYGAGLTLGYSIVQVFDVVVFGDYLPGKRRHASFGKETASFVLYGGGVGLRLAESVFIGVRGGQAVYTLVKQTADNEVDGFWVGYGGCFSIGAIMEQNKSNFWQLSLDLTAAEVQPLNGYDDSEETNKRQIESFGVTLAYVFNRKDSLFMGGGILGDFMNSLGF